MPRKTKKDKRKLKAWTLLVARRATAIKLNNTGKTAQERKQPQKRTSWKYRDGRIRGITEPDKIKNDRYALAAHQIYLALADIDTMPGMPKAEFRLQTKRECQKQLNEYVDGELFARCPSLRAKTVHRSFSESGKGLHLLFWQPDPELRTGRTATEYGDFFNGDGYFIPSDPEKLLLDISVMDNKEPLTEAEIEFLSPVKKSEPIIAKPGKKHVPVQNDFDIVSILQSAVGSHNMNLRLSDKIDKNGKDLYTWSPYQIAKLMEKISPVHFSDYDFWIKLGMALHDAGTSPLLFQIWISLAVSLSPCSKSWHSRFEAKWMSFTRGSGISMGTICHEAGYECRDSKDFSDIGDYINQYIAFTESRKFVSRSAIHQHYSASGISNAPHTDCSFRRHFKAKIDVRSKNRVFSICGIVKVAPLYEEAVLKGVRGYRGIRIRNEWEAAGIRMAINLGREMDL